MLWNIMLLKALYIAIQHYHNYCENILCYQDTLNFVKILSIVSECTKNYTGIQLTQNTCKRLQPTAVELLYDCVATGNHTNMTSEL